MTPPTNEELVERVREAYHLQERYFDAALATLSERLEAAEEREEGFWRRFPTLKALEESLRAEARAEAAEAERDRLREAIGAALDVLHDPAQMWLPAAEILSVALARAALADQEGEA